MTHEIYGLSLALMVQRVPPASVVRTGPLVIDLPGRRVTVDGLAVALSGREWGILAYLAEHVGRFCSNEDIVRDVFGPAWVTGRRWPGKRKGRSDLHALTVPLCRLRKRLGAAGALITSVSHYHRTGRRLENVEAPR